MKRIVIALSGVACVGLLVGLALAARGATSLRSSGSNPSPPGSQPLTEAERSARFWAAYPQTLAEGPVITKPDGTPHTRPAPDLRIWSEAEAIAHVKRITGVSDWRDHAVTPTDRKTWWEHNRQETFYSPPGYEDVEIGRVWIVGFVADGGITNENVAFALGAPEPAGRPDAYTAEGLIVAIDDIGEVLWHFEIEDIHQDLWKKGVLEVPAVPVVTAAPGRE